ncbi:MAG: hypothetical protein AAGG46_11975, partial [Planctomycetota bacterium]
MHAPATAVLPGWFRGVLVALVTLLMCSCQAPIDVPPAAQNSESADGRDGGPIFRGQSPEPTSPSDLVVRDALLADQSVQAPAAQDTAPQDTAARDDAIDPVGCLGCPPSGGNSMGGANCRACVVPPGTPLGPRDEYLCDGGDCGLKVGLRQDLTVTGLEQEDTVAHYDTLDGATCITPSNRVCIYAPRFGAVRRVVNPSESNQRRLINVLEDDASLAQTNLPLPPVAAIVEQPPVTKIGERPPSLLINRQQAGELEARVVVRELSDLIKPYANLQIVKLGLMDNAEKPWLASAIVSALTWTGDQAAQVVIEQKAASV